MARFIGTVTQALYVIPTWHGHTTIEGNGLRRCRGQPGRSLCLFLGVVDMTLRMTRTSDTESIGHCKPMSYISKSLIRIPSHRIYVWHIYLHLP